MRIETAESRPCRRLKTEALRFEDLRHAFATGLVAENRNIALISKLSGLSRLTTTMPYARLQAKLRNPP
ncbi:MAG: tyrosine-type recombinase/integrase [Blastocatellia bacterium]